MVPGATPPAFEEAAQCAVCGCSFGTFKRRHHCRACGRSLCNEHSSNQMALPHFGLHAPVRVCNNCFTEANSNSRTTESVSPEAAVSSEGSEVDSSVASLSALKLDEAEQPANLPVPEVNSSTTEPVFECKCGMPLCICATPEPPKASPSPAPQVSATSSRNKRVSTVSSTPKQPSSTTSVKHLPSLFFTSGQSVHDREHAFSRSYDVSGEGMREAIKNGDPAAVKDLLSKGVDANYTDKQGMSLLHLAAVFNLTDVAFMLMEAGASPHSRNSQGETPLDCAQTTLQYKLQQKLQELDR